MLVSKRLVLLIRELFVIDKVQHILLAEMALVISAAVFVPLLERTHPDAKITTLGEGLWWAIVTVTSTGYGDYYPVTLGGKIIAIILMLSGLTFLSTVIALISSFYSRARAIRQTKQIFDNLERIETRTRRIEKKIDFLVKDGLIDSNNESLIPPKHKASHVTS